MKSLDLLSEVELPKGFNYPRQFNHILELGLTELQPWYLLGGKPLRAAMAGLAQRYPTEDSFHSRDVRITTTSLAGKTGPTKRFSSFMTSLRQVGNSAGALPASTTGFGVRLKTSLSSTRESRMAPHKMSQHLSYPKDIVGG